MLGFKLNHVSEKGPWYFHHRNLVILKSQAESIWLTIPRVTEQPLPRPYEKKNKLQHKHSPVANRFLFRELFVQSNFTNASCDRIYDCNHISIALSLHLYQYIQYLNISLHTIAIKDILCMLCLAISHQWVFSHDQKNKRCLIGACYSYVIYWVSIYQTQVYHHVIQLTMPLG